MEPLLDREEVLRAVRPDASADELRRIDTVLSRFKLDLDIDPGTVEGMSEQLTQVAAEQLSARLLRIERSVLRQERISLEILSSLRRIVAGARKGRNGNGPSSGPSNDAPG